MPRQWTVLKHGHPLRGTYARILQLSESALSTHDPVTRASTNRWSWLDVASAEADGAQLVVTLVPRGCELCGLLRERLVLELPTSALADDARRQIIARLVRTLGADEPPPPSTSASRGTTPPTHRRSGSGGGAVAAASPSSDPTAARRGSSERSSLPRAGAPSAPTSPAPPPPEGAPMHFEVRLAVQKARNLPMPPALWANPHVECVWGAPPDDDDADDGVVDGGGGGAAEAAGSAPVRFATPAAPNDAVAPRWNFEATFSCAAAALAHTTLPPLLPAARRSPLTPPCAPPAAGTSGRWRSCAAAASSSASATAARSSRMRRAASSSSRSTRLPSARRSSTCRC